MLNTTNTTNTSNATNATPTPVVDPWAALKAYTAA